MQPIVLKTFWCGEFKARLTVSAPVPVAVEAATAQGKRQPLTDEQIHAARWSASKPDGFGLPQSTDNEVVMWSKNNHVLAFARAIEAAHGIKQ